jgi:hypothetical protein
MKIYIFLVLLMTGLFAYSQTTIPDQYDFPIKQGSMEWEQIGSVEKRIVALQIPEDILSQISTEGLLETCLAFPYLTDILFYNDYQKGFDELVAEFNGYREFLDRPDLNDVLLKKYKDSGNDIESIRTLSLVEQGRFSFRHFVLEFMLAQDRVLKQLEPEQEKQLFILSQEQKTHKRSNPDIFGSMNNVPTNLLYAKLVLGSPEVKLDEVTRVQLSNFVQAPLDISEQIIDNIESKLIVQYEK